jgi:hypothetical protein
MTMTNLILRDLPDSKVLDTTTMHELKGGMFVPGVPLFGITTAGAHADANAIGPNGGYVNTYTNAFAYKDPLNLVAVATATSNSVAVAY